MITGSSLKKYIIFLLTLALFTTAYIIFRQYNPRLGFTYFEPTHLPPNVSIKEKRINIFLGHAAVEQNFRTEDSDGA